MKEDKKTPANRKKTGMFKPGESGNPSGRPKIPEDIKQAFKDLTPVAIEKLKEIINDPNSKPCDRLRAIDIVLDRGLGKPAQELSIETTSAPQVIFIGADNVRD